MFSYITKFYNYLMGKNDNEESDEEKEKYLAEQLLELEIEADKEKNPILIDIVEVPKNTICFQKTGVITYCGENYVLIDGMIYHEVTTSTVTVNVNDKVLYLGYKDINDSVVVVRILENQGLFWGDEEESEEKNFNIIEHVLIGQVDYRENRIVFMKGSDLTFSLDEVEGTFVPIEGDWLEMKCSMQQDEKNLTDMSMHQVLRVICFNPIRSKVKSAIVTEWTGTDGICDRQIYFNNTALVNGSQPYIGSKVLVEAIESMQGRCNWRAIKIVVAEHRSHKIPEVELSNEEQISLELEKEKCIEMTYPLKFEYVSFKRTDKIFLNLSNKSNQVYFLNKWIVLSKKKDSQITVTPIVFQQIRLKPEESVTFTITCHPKFLGNSKESLVISFKGFQLKRVININIVDDNISLTGSLNHHTSMNASIENMRKIKNSEMYYIPGERPFKVPGFIPVKIGTFPIPDKIWKIVLDNTGPPIYTNEFKNTLARIENHFPCMVQELNITNYITKWHMLLYLEEIQANLNMRYYDEYNVYLTHCDEYLCIEIPGLAEKRPSLIRGHRAIVKEIGCDGYEGFIHCIQGNLVLMKFNSQFHNSYCGSPVSIEFHFSRTIFRRSHHAINLALSNLGPDILFPTRLLLKGQQILDENIKNIKWYNPKLNDGQKNAVINILKGECRPMPYIIFGPPGTGKTVTVIETILQILKWIPDSRILVATPSNSASNLITERLIQYKGLFKGSIVRLIASYLVESDTLPDIIKPFCATLDIATENTSRKNSFVKDNINVNCPKSLIGRHRITIGTCYCLGSLKHIDLPRAHFTHIIIDEAGQATEPEIMLPLTFTDKEHGQIVLAGDPMQLGPVIISKYCNELGMNESFLCRILDRFPYLKDYDAYKDGFDRRLVTKLNNNYRSLKEVLTLPSEMFYDGTLVPNIDKSMPFCSKFINATCEIFDSRSNDGGIYVYGIKGVNVRADDSPSWYNPHEASMVALTACKLYKKNVTADEIGVVTPYIAQKRYLRIIFDSMGLPQPKIGTVEDFQGQERPIILISTVRSNESEEDSTYSLGFINNPKRFNVTLTRAQVSSIVFCNPHLLVKDHLWSKVIAKSVSTDKYMGCDLPVNYFSNTSE